MALEQVILDDASIAVGRTALNLNSGSIKVAEGGIDWDDAAIEPYLADMSRGSAPVDFRVPNRQVSIPLILGANGQSGYSTARRNVQAKAALHQREGGWLKRVMKNGEVCYLDVVNATLRLSGDSSASQLDIDGNALLTLDTLPDFYGDEITLSDHTETTSPELIFTEATVKGDYPGRLRLVVDDDQGVDQRGLIAGFRARNYSNASTAALAYPAQSLTALDTASNATVASRATVRHSSLAATWTPVLGTNLTAGTFLTHVGAYRVWAYLYSTSTTTVKARFVSDVGDLIQPAENDPVTIPGSSNWYLMDLGQIYLDKMPVGSHRWAGQVQAKGASGGENIAVARLMFQPLDESACKIQAQTISANLLNYTARDAFNQSAGALAGKTADLGGNWSGAGDTDDFAVSGSGLLQRTAVSDTAGTGRYARLGTGTATNVFAQVDLSDSSGLLTMGSLSRMALLLRYIDTNNWLAAGLLHNGTKRGVALTKKVAGTVTELGFLELGASGAGLANVGAITIAAYVGADGGARVWAEQTGVALSSPRLTVVDSVLATAGTLASGGYGLLDERSAASAMTRYYDNFKVAAQSMNDAVVYASRSAQLTTQGNFRQDSTGTAYGPTAPPNGDLLRIPPSGLEGRTVECLVKMSRGNLSTEADGGIDDLSARLYYRPCWLTAPGS